MSPKVKLKLIWGLWQITTRVSSVYRVAQLVAGTIIAFFYLVVQMLVGPRLRRDDDLISHATNASVVLFFLLCITRQYVGLTEDVDQWLSRTRRVIK